MKFQLVEVEELSGPQTAIYTVILDGDEESLLDRFVRENIDQYRDEVQDILGLLDDIAFKHGAREHFFKIHEGAPGDGVCALYDDPDHNLRLYCIRYARSTIILGGGGFKPKHIRALQEDHKLNTENSLVRVIAKQIEVARKNGDMTWDGQYFDGFIFPPEDENEV